MRNDTANAPLTPEQIEHRREWAAALRSGEYAQTRRYLRRDKADVYPAGFCCLGVACDKASVGEWLTSSGAPAVRVYQVSPLTDWSRTALPEAVAEEFGVTAQEEDRLQRANDRGETFEQIADRIDAETRRRTPSDAVDTDSDDLAYL